MKVNWKQILVSIVGISALFLIFFYAQLNRGIRPFQKAKSETIALAQQKSDLEKPENFYWFNGEETYFTVTGTDKNKNELIVIVKQKGGDMVILDSKDTISRKEAVQLTIDKVQPKKILEARIGIIDETPIWEVSFLNNKGQLGYNVLQLEDGQWLHTLENI